MIVMFLVVAAVLVVINWFVFMVLRRVAVRTGKKIRANAMRQFSVFDKLAQKRMDEIEELNEKKAALYTTTEQPISAKPQTAPFVPKLSHIEKQRKSAKYLDAHFSHKYCVVKEAMGADKEAQIMSLLSRLDVRGDSVYESIVKKLDTDSLFALSTMEKEEQIEILRQSLDENEEAVLDTYLRGVAAFDCIAFYDWISAECFVNDQTVFIRTGNKTDSFDHLSDCIKTIYDEAICEGFVAEHQNTLYDFGVLKREIS